MCVLTQPGLWQGSPVEEIAPSTMAATPLSQLDQGWAAEKLTSVQMDPTAVSGTTTETVTVQL